MAALCVYYEKDKEVEGEEMRLKKTRKLGRREKGGAAERCVCVEERKRRKKRGI